MKKPIANRVGIWAFTFIAATATGYIALADDPQSSNSAESKTASAKEQSPEDAAIERTREVVQMLDNIYKQTIVLITDKYVHSETDFPAGSAAVALFDIVSGSGSHKVRLLDATGDPIDFENTAKDEFEKQGIKRLKSGEKYVEEVVQLDGKRQLRALTPVPVVMDKCIMCHAHYADVAEGEPIGAISYTIPIR